MRPSICLTEQVSAIDVETLVTTGFPRRPGHFHRLDAVNLAEAEVDPRVRGRLVPASVVTSTNRPPSLRKRWSGIDGKSGGPQKTKIFRASSKQALRVLAVPVDIMADVEIEVAVAVEVGEGRRGGPVAVARRGPAFSVMSSNVPSPLLRKSA